MLSQQVNLDFHETVRDLLLLGLEMKERHLQEVPAPRDRYQGEVWRWLKKAGILSWARLWKNAQKGCSPWSYRTKKCTL